MARAERPRGQCPVCSKDCAITEEGGVRHHFTDTPEQQAGPDSRKCRGVGEPPAGAKPAPGGLSFLCRVPSGPEGCGHQVQLTANHRARSHLTPHGTPCAEGGSAWPIAVGPDGYRADTTDWTEEQWTEALPKPVRGGEILQAAAPEDLKIEPDRDFDPRDATVQEPVTEVWHLEDTHTTAYSDGSVWAGRKPVETIDLPHDRTSFEQDTCQPLDPALRDGLMDTFGRAQNGSPHPDASGGAFIAELKTAVGDPGTVANQLSAYQGLPRLDPVECACNLEWANVEAMRRAGHGDMDCNDAPMVAGPVEQEDVFDVVHRVTDESGTAWIHPGEAAGCRLPECCTHPRGFDWVDDDNGHSGSFCRFCGAEEPEPLAPEWGTPSDLLAKMPADLVAQYATEPPCWDCGDRLMLAVNRFAPDGTPEQIVWVCDRDCEQTGGSGHYGRGCRPQMPWEDRLGYLERGAFFRRHTANRPLDSLVYRVDAVGEDVDIVSAIVVSAGRYQGRVGELTDLSEEITCTDHNGQRLRRQSLPAPAALAPAAPSPTPSRPAPTTRNGPQDATNSPTRTPTGSGPGSTRRIPGSAPGAGASSTPETASGPTAKAATSVKTAGKTDVPKDAFATAKQATSESDKYDRFGRYKLTHPATGKPVKWTRATTYAKSIADTYNLSMWAQRMTLKGAALRPDIVAAVSTLDVKADRDRVNALVEDAKKAAGNKVAANLGTALHSFTEDRDKVLVGLPVTAKEIPEKLLPSVDAYEALLREFGLVPVPGLIEFTTAVQQYEIAGTSDRCYRVTRDITFKLHGRTVTLYAGEYVIGDVKSGADLSYGWMEICVQLAIYAQGINTSGVFDWNTATWGHPTVPGQDDVQITVRTDVGLIPHLPVDREPDAPLATLFAVDLDWGWATAVLCGQVRSARKEGNLATALTVADVEEAPEAPNEPLQRAAARARTVVSRPPTLEEKARAVTTQAAASAVWKEAVAARTPKPEVDRLVQVMKTALERLVEKGA
jgi:hypothetical protein